MTPEPLAATELRNVAVSIGVQGPEKLTFVAAAVNGARAFSEWAIALGYDTTLITDEAQPLTIERLAKHLEAALIAGNSPIQRLVLYFAGHGLIREAEQGLWLLSDWDSSLRAVAVEPLRRRLSRFNIQQIAIFADCCRSLPPTMDAADLTPDAVLGRGPYATNAPEVDKFIAAQDGTAAFAVPGANPEDDRCIFSGVLLEGLWGTDSNAFSQTVVGKVTSRSLGKFLKTKVPDIASRYGKTLEPNVTPSFSDGFDIYCATDLPAKRPTFPEWPAPAAGLAAQGPDVTDRQFSTRGTKFGTLSSKPGSKLNGDAPRPFGFKTGSGFEVKGRNVLRLWVPQNCVATIFGNTNCWRIRTADGRELVEPAPVLIEFDGGLSAAVTALPDFLTSVVCDERGVSALTYRGIGRELGTASSVKAIEQLERGVLRADDVRELAMSLRADKHVDPVLGVISAYLYDSINDVDNIRRMAHYYIEHGQAIPYDVCLLAQLNGQWDGQKFRVTIPATTERLPVTTAEQGSPWTYNATVSGAGIVGGVWPWLTQGWAFLADSIGDDSSIVLPQLIDVKTHLTKARFATFDAEGAQAIAALLQLVPQEPLG
ncbi:MAG: hypothetical protein ABJB74_05925 [Gemmatimonas sp.]